MDQQQRSTGRGTGGSTRNVLFAEIANKKSFVTQGNGTAVAVQVGPVFRDVGPYLQDIVVHCKGYTSTNGFFYAVQAEFSYDGEQWEPFTANLITVVAADVSKSKVSSAYTTRTDFGRHIRFLVETDDNNTGVAAAQLSLAVAFRFLS
jgi:hypothetical protein